MTKDFHTQMRMVRNSLLNISDPKMYKHTHSSGLAFYILQSYISMKLLNFGVQIL